MLRGHVRWRADDGADLSEALGLARTLEDEGRAKVEDLHEVRAISQILNHDVRWFEVAMQDVLGVGRAERVTDLSQDSNGPFR